jgi:hypothetical protein
MSGINFRKPKIIVIVSLILGSVQLQGQTPFINPPPPGEFDYSGTHFLAKVIFHQPTDQPASWIVIRKDDNTANISPDPTFTEAYKLGDDVKPVAYVSGSKARVEATFFVDCPEPEFWVWGDGPGSYDLPKIKFTNNNVVMVYTADMENTFTYKEVRYWEKFEINWYFSKTKNGQGELIGTSDNPLYVTHKDKVAHPDLIHFNTLLYLGCKNATGKKAESIIVENIFDEFKDWDVRKIGGTRKMTYYRPVAPGLPFGLCYTAKELLIEEDGRCGAWSDFFRDILLMQGIPVDRVSFIWNYAILPASEDVTTLIEKVEEFFGEESENITYTIEQGYEGHSGHRGQFFIKKWESVPANSFSLSDHNNPTPTSISLNNGNVIYDKDIEGIDAQGNTNPFSEFSDHSVVKYNETYYDPSYGKKYQAQYNPQGELTSSAENEVESGSIQYFGTVFTYTKEEVGMPEKNYFISWFGHLNDPMEQIASFFFTD